MFSNLARPLITLLANLLALLLLDWLLPWFDIKNRGSRLNEVLILLGGLLVLSLLNSIVRPTLVRLTLRINVLTLGLLSLVINGLMVFAVRLIIPGFDVRNILAGIVIALALTVVNLLLEGLLYGKQDRQLRDYRRIKMLARTIANRGDGTTPGLIMLEIDGLAAPILQRALQEGHMPTLAEWVQSGRYKIAQWDSGLPSQTSAMQAGILHGSHRNIPAFRWYDKAQGRLLVSGNAADADDILRPLLNGAGILHEHGFSLNNWAYGDAPEVVLTFSTMTEQRLGVFAQADNLYSYFADAGNLPRMVGGIIGDIWVEWREARYQRRHDVLPRVPRGGIYPLVRAITTAVLPQLSCYLIVTKMFEGIAAAYTTFVSYDEVAHHSGIDRPDAFRILREIDTQFAWIARAAQQATRPYEFVILSDHGQSQGATFTQRYGLSLPELVTSLLDAEHQAAASVGGDTGVMQVNMLLTSAIQSDRWVGRPARRLLKRRTVNGYVDLAKSTNRQAVQAAKTVVCASGNLGLIHFTEWPERLSAEQIAERFPGFIEQLVVHPGIGFILVHSAQRGGLVLGKAGIYYLDDDTIEGENPLAVFGPHAAAHLRELDSYSNTGDVVVNSFYDPATGEVAAFEELVGSHGGLGGMQNTPFLLYPAHLQPDGDLPELVGAPAIYAVLQRWLARLQHPTALNPAPAAAPPPPEPTWPPPQPAPSSS